MQTEISPLQKITGLVYVLAITAAILLSSCSTTKHTNKTTTTANTETDTRSTATNTAITQSTVTEIAQGEITPAKDSTEFDFDQAALDSGVTEITPTATTTIKKDPVTNRVIAKSVFAPAPVKFNINKTTITNKAEGSTTVTDKKETAHVKQAVKTKDKEVKGLNWNCLWWLLLLLLIPIWRFRKVLLG